jgi:hypothetical protein
MGSCLTGVCKRKGRKLSDGKGKRKGGRHFHDTWVVGLNPRQNLSTIAMGSVYPERSTRSLNSSI